MKVPTCLTLELRWKGKATLQKDKDSDRNKEKTMHIYDFLFALHQSRDICEISIANGIFKINGFSIVNKRIIERIKGRFIDVQIRSNAFQNKLSCERNKKKINKTTQTISNASSVTNTNILFGQKKDRISNSTGSKTFVLL